MKSDTCLGNINEYLCLPQGYGNVVFSTGLLVILQVVFGATNAPRPKLFGLSHGLKNGHPYVRHLGKESSELIAQNLFNVKFHSEKVLFSSDLNQQWIGCHRHILWRRSLRLARFLQRLWASFTTRFQGISRRSGDLSRSG